MTPRFGIAAALPAEARIPGGTPGDLTGEGQPFRHGLLPGGTEFLTIQSGPGPERAARAARWLVDQGAKVLFSLGISGGLEPALERGRLIIVEQVRMGDQVWPVETAWTLDAEKLLTGNNLSVSRGAIITVDKALTNPDEKARWYGSTGALAADMESGSVARVAGEYGLSFAALRTVCDTAHDSLPHDPESLVRADGRVKVPALAGRLISHPALLMDLFRWGKAYRESLKVLGRAWKLLAEERILQELVSMAPSS
jgi:adenosylhomocysteine nucleosidase